MSDANAYDGFIFTHIPKCGGSSLRRLVYDSCIASDIKVDQIHIPGEGGLSHEKNIRQLTTQEFQKLKSRNIKVLADHTKLDFDLYSELGMKNPFVFTVTRTPFNRFLSHYNFFYKKVGHGKLKNRPIQSLENKRLETIVSQQANVMAAYLLNMKPGSQNSAEFANRLDEIESILSSRINVVGTLDDINNCIQQIGSNKPNWLVWNTELSTINSNNYKPDFQGIKRVRQLFAQYNQIDIRLYQYIKALSNLRTLKQHYAEV